MSINLSGTHQKSFSSLGRLLQAQSLLVSASKLQRHDVNKQVGMYKEVLIKCLDACVPIVTKDMKRPFTPSTNDDLHRALKIRKIDKSNLKADKHITRLQELYKRETKHVQSLIRKTKADHYHAQGKQLQR